MSSWSTPGKSEQLPLAVRWLDQPPTLQLQAAQVNDALRWTALFQAFSSHQQPSAQLTKGIPQLEVVLTSQKSTTKDVKLVQSRLNWLSKWVL